MDKAIKHGKEKRKPYFGAQAIDATCRNHGSCDFCKGNRLYQSSKAQDEIDSKLKEWEEERE